MAEAEIWSRMSREGLHEDNVKIDSGIVARLRGRSSRILA
jgi:hypothetical protein